MRFAAWQHWYCLHEEVALAVRDDDELYLRCVKCKREVNP